jgi:hypothetical protein
MRICAALLMVLLGCTTQLRLPRYSVVLDPPLQISLTNVQTVFIHGGQGIVKSLSMFGMFDRTYLINARMPGSPAYWSGFKGNESISPPFIEGRLNPSELSAAKSREDLHWLGKPFDGEMMDNDFYNVEWRFLAVGVETWYATQVDVGYIGKTRELQYMVTSSGSGTMPPTTKFRGSVSSGTNSPLISSANPIKQTR